MAQGAGCRVQGAGCRVQGAEFRVQGSGYRVVHTSPNLPAPMLSSITYPWCSLPSHLRGQVLRFDFRGLFGVSF